MTQCTYAMGLGSIGSVRLPGGERVPSQELQQQTGGEPAQEDPVLVTLSSSSLDEVVMEAFLRG